MRRIIPMKSRFRTFIAFCASLSLALAGLPAFACQTVTPQQIENALQNAPGINPGLQSCAMAAMAMKESGGGNTCAANSCCVGILQLNVGSSGVDMTPAQRAAYQNADLQTQVNGWTATANGNASSSGYKMLLADYNSGQSIGGAPVTPGMLAACEQFGAAVCNHNVSSLSSTGGCGSYTDGTGHTGGQTICSWGKAADKQAANQNCSKNGTAPTPPTTPKKINCPTPGGGAPGTAIPPTPASAPVSLPANLA